MRLRPVLLLLCMLVVQAGAASAQVTAIRAGRVVDPHAGTSVENQVILVESGKITAIGGNVAIPAGATMIDLSASTISPGLVDAHTHLCMSVKPGRDAGSYYYTTLRDPDAVRAVEGVINARSMLQAGFTSVRDIGKQQSAGRGRGGNAWMSPPGGLYASWLGWLAAEALDAVPLAAAVSLAEAVESLQPGVEVRLKWPNDLVAGGGKLGGILCQSRVAGSAAWVVVGLGVNLAVAPALGVDAGRTTCLAELGWSGETGPACWRVVSAFVAGLRPALADVPRTLAAWHRRSVHVAGELMHVRLDGEMARVSLCSQLGMVEMKSTSSNASAAENMVSRYVSL